MANDRNDRLKQRRDKLAKTIILLVFSMIVFIVATIAWFTMSRETESEAIAMKSTGLDFELAVPVSDNYGAISYPLDGEGGDPVAINDMPGAIGAPNGTRETYDVIDSTSGDFYTTDASNETIKWRLTSSYDATFDGLGPDSYGDFMFYVVPKINGDLDINIDISLSGYSADVKKNEDGTYNASDLAEITSTDEHYSAIKYLNSHILFFTGRTGEGTDSSPYKYNGLIGYDGISLSLSNCEEDVRIPVHVYWKWANTFADMACIAGPSTNIASDSTTISQLRDYLIENRADILKMDADTALSYMADTSESGGETVYTFNTEKAAHNITALSVGYNNGDQEIGNFVRYFLLLLGAEK